ncbi:MAG: hypothetical protein EZS28_037202, partial [Streblomastix strix]
DVVQLIKTGWETLEGMRTKIGQEQWVQIANVLDDGVRKRLHEYFGFIV